MKKTAFVFMELQNDFLNENGKMSILKGKENIVKNAEKLMQKARDDGEMVVHVHLSFSKDQIEGSKGVLAHVEAAGAFLEGTEGVSSLSQFQPKEGELCIKKHTISAFEQTNLEKALRDKGITDIVFVGLLSNICIESSVRDAYDKGFNPIVIKDATATLDEKGHQHSTENVLPFFASVSTTEQCMQKM